MVLKTVLKVDISCQKCKKKVLQAVSTLQGVDKIELDEAKGTVTVTGDADPYDIIIRTKKTGKHVEVVTIGPPPAPPKPEQKKPVEKKAEEKKAEEKKPAQKPIIYDSYNYPPYPPVVMVPVSHYDEPNSSCAIM